MTPQAGSQRVASLVMWGVVCAGAAACNGSSPKPAGPAQASAKVQKAPLPDNKPPQAALPKEFQGIEGQGAALWMNLVTTQGEIQCELFPDKAPRTVRHIVGLARGRKPFIDPQTQTLVRDTPFYDGLIVHRVMPGFMIQMGDPTGDGHSGPGFVIKDEIHPALRHDAPGVLSMANAGPDTTGSQFFITLKPMPHLDGHHNVFGRCESLQVVAKIASMPADANNRPTAPPTIKRVDFQRRPKQ